MKPTREYLENWIFGLLGYEERTFIVVRRLIQTVLEDGHSRIYSTLKDVETDSIYEFNLEIKKLNSSNKNTDLKSNNTHNTDNESVMSKLLDKYSHELCVFDGECEYKQKRLKE